MNHSIPASNAHLIAYNVKILLKNVHRVILVILWLIINALIYVLHPLNITILLVLHVKIVHHNVYNVLVLDMINAYPVIFLWS